MIDETNLRKVDPASRHSVWAGQLYEQCSGFIVCFLELSCLKMVPQGCVVLPSLRSSRTLLNKQTSDVLCALNPQLVVTSAQAGQAGWLA